MSRHCHYFFSLTFLLCLSACSGESFTREVTVPFVDLKPITRTYITPKTELPRIVALLPFAHEPQPDTPEGKKREKQLQLASRILRQSLFGDLKLKSFRAVPLADTDEAFTALQLKPSGMMDRNAIAELCRELQVDGIISGELTKASNLTEGVYAETLIRAQFWFWNRKGELLWTADHQESFRGGIYDLGQAVELVVNQMENTDQERSFRRQAAELSKEVAETLPSYWLNSFLPRNFQDPVPASSALLALPFVHEKKGEKEGSDYLTLEIGSALARRGCNVYPAKKVEEIFPGEDFGSLSAPRLARKARASGIAYLLFGKVEKWSQFYGVLHSQATCDFSLELWDTRTGRRIFSNRYSKSLASGLIKGPTSLAAVVITPVTGMEKKRSYRNAYDLVELASSELTKLLEHREARSDGTKLQTPETKL